MKLQIKVQVLIVGLGPAGTACSLGLSESEVNMLAIDRAFFPRDKICGDALPSFALSYLSKWALFGTQSKHIYQSHFRMKGSFRTELLPFIPNRHEFSQDGDSFETKSKNFSTIRRFHLDNTLVQNCLIRRVPIKFGWQVMQMKPDLDSGAWKVSGLIRNKHGQKTGTFQINADVVVGCDGVSSIIRRASLSSYNDRLLAIASRTYSLVGSKNKAQASIIDHRWPGTNSYYWSFKVAGGMNSGVVFFPDVARKMGKKLVAITRKLSPSGDAIRTMAIPILSEGDNEEPAEGVLLTGDAASLVDPYLGHGIDRALESGELAAQVLREGFNKKNTPAEISRRFREELAPRRRLWLKMGLNFQSKQANGVESLKNRLLVKSFLNLIKDS